VTNTYNLFFMQAGNVVRLPTKADPGNDPGRLKPLPRKLVDGAIFCKSVRVGQQVEYAKVVTVQEEERTCTVQWMRPAEVGNVEQGWLAFDVSPAESEDGEAYELLDVHWDIILDCCARRQAQEGWTEDRVRFSSTTAHHANLTGKTI
jgi:hypothetical protein